jgi:hypothetical protein
MGVYANKPKRHVYRQVNGSYRALCSPNVSEGPQQVRLNRLAEKPCKACQRAFRAS